jgi:hypothetical protein
MLQEDWAKSSYSHETNCLEARWKKSTRSGAGACVEARIEDGNVQIRDTKDNGAGPILSFTGDEWSAFLGGAKAGEFDLPA